MPKFAAIVLAAALALPAGAANVYKCTGADGKVYYSGQPCPASDKRETVRVQRPSPETQEEGEPRKTLDDRIAETEDPVEKAQLELQKKQCDVARAQLERYNDAPYLIEKQADGTERRLSEEETAAEKEKLRNLLQERC